MSQSRPASVRRPLGLERPLLLLMALLLAAFTLPLISSPARAADGDPLIDSPGNGGVNTFNGQVITTTFDGGDPWIKMGSEVFVPGVRVCGYWVDGLPGTLPIQAGDDGAVSPTYCATTDAGGKFSILFKSWTDAAGTLHQFGADVNEGWRIWVDQGTIPAGYDLRYSEGNQQLVNSVQRDIATINAGGSNVLGWTFALAQEQNFGLHTTPSPNTPLLNGLGDPVNFVDGTVFWDTRHLYGTAERYPVQGAVDLPAANTTVTVTLRRDRDGALYTVQTKTDANGKYRVYFPNDWSVDGSNLGLNTDTFKIYATVGTPSDTMYWSLFDQATYRTPISIHYATDNTSPADLLAGGYNIFTSPPAMITGQITSMNFALLPNPKFDVVPYDTTTKFAQIGDTATTSTKGLIPDAPYTITWYRENPDPTKQPIQVSKCGPFNAGPLYSVAAPAIPDGPRPLTVSLESVPAGFSASQMFINPNTGAVNGVIPKNTSTPDPADFLQGSFALKLKVTYADGSTQSVDQPFTVPGVVDPYDVQIPSCDLTVPGTITSDTTYQAILTDADGTLISSDAFLAAIPKLSMTKAAPAGGLTEGVAAPYTFTVKNDATAKVPAKSATFRDTLPAGFQLDASMLDPDGTEPAAAGKCVVISGQTVECTVPGDIAPGATKAFDMMVVAVNIDPAVTTVDNYASVDPKGGTSPTDPAPCTDTNTPAGCAQAIDTPVTQFSATEANPDGTVGTAYDDSVNPTFVGGTGPFTYAAPAADLPPGLAMGTDGKITGTPTTAGSYTFTVTVKDSLGNTATYTDTIVIAPAPLPSLTIAKKGPGTMTVGNPGNFTITVTNASTAAATGVKVVDVLPAGLTFVPSTTLGSSSDPACSPAGQTITCTVDVPATGARTIVVTAVASTSAASSVTNVAVVNADGSGTPTTPTDGTCTGYPANTCAVSDPATVIVPASAPTKLTLKKEVIGTLTEGQEGTYRLTVTNEGGVTAIAGLMVVDQLPQNVKFISGPTGCFDDGSDPTVAPGQVVDCRTQDTILGGSSLVIDLKVMPLPGTAATVTNVAAVDPTGDGEAFPDPSIDCAASPLPAGCGSTGPVAVADAPTNLTLTKTAQTGGFTEGVNGTYTLTVENTGGTASPTNVKVVDNLPANLEYVSATSTTANVSCPATVAVGGTFTCTIGDPIAAGAKVTITLTVKPQIGAAATVTNVAAVNPDGTDTPDPALCTGSPLPDGCATSGPVTVADAPTNLTLTKTAQTGGFKEGVNGTYTLTVENTGGTASPANVEVVDDLPANLEYVSATSTTANVNCPATVAVGGTFTCTIGDPIAAGAKVTITLTVKPQIGAAATVTNVAAVNPDGTDTPDPALCTGSPLPDGCATSGPVTVADAPTNLTLTKTAQTGGFKEGVNGTYTLTVENTGGTASPANVKVVDNLPADMEYVSGTGTGVTCSDPATVAVGGVVTCTIANSIAPGDKVTITLTVKPTANSNSTVSNTAAVNADGAGTPDPTNCTGTTVCVTAGPTSVENTDPVLSLTKTGTDMTVGTPAAYTLTVKNTGIVEATSATVLDQLPPYIQYVSATGGGCSIAGGTVATGQLLSCTVNGPIAATNGTATLTINVMPEKGAAANVTNLAAVDTTGGTQPTLTPCQTDATAPGCASDGGHTVTTPTVPATLTGSVDLPNGTKGVSYTSTAPTVDGGTGPYTYSATGLPPGTTIDPNTGVISGTPTKDGAYPIVITVKSADGQTLTLTDTVTIGLPPIAIDANGTLPDGQVGSTYTGPAPSTSGGDGTYTYTSPNLPPGLTINPGTGVISGTPTTPGTYPVTVVVKDGAGNSTSFTQDVVIKPAPLTATGTITDGFVGQPFKSDAPTVAGGTGPYTFESTKLPAGLTIDPKTGIISGTPTQGGTFTVTITVTSADGQVTSYADTFVIDSGPIEVVANNDLPNGTVDTPYTSQPPTVTGGTGPYVFTVPDGTLPPGTTIDPNTGVISGTPTTPGDYPVTITVTDKDGKTTTINDTIVISPKPVDITGGMDLPNGMIGDPYTGPAPVVTGGAGGNTFTATTLPEGLTIDPKTGVISGTPKSEGTYTITVTVTDKSGNTDSFSDTILIGSTPLEITAGANLPNGTVGTPYNATAPTVTGGTGPYTFNPGTTLPPGLTMDPKTGAISGTPTQAGEFTVTVTVTDANGKTTTYTDTVIIGYPAVTVTAWKDATAETGTPFTGEAPKATGGDGSYTWTSTGLPAGLTIDPKTGVVSGTPTVPGTYTWTLTADDGNGNTASVSQTLVVNNPFVVVTPSDIPDGKVGDPYTYDAELINPGTGDPAAMGTCTMDVSQLPPGLTFDSATCAITGVPTKAGEYPVTIEVVDGPDGMTTTIKDTIIIKPADLVIKSDPLPDGKEGDAYTGPTPVVAGGTGGNTFTSTTLPEGLKIDPNTGVISGTPTNDGTYTVTITVTDSDGNKATFEDTFVIKGDPITVTAGADLPNGKVGDSYTSPTPKVEGGTGPYTFNDNGSLPPGLTIDPKTGVVTGTPTKEGTYVVTIVVKDAAGHTTSYTDTVVIGPKNPPLVITGGPTLPNGTVDSPYVTPKPTPTGGDGNYTWTAEGLPPGLTIDAKTGAVTGTPTAEGTYKVVTKVTDGTGKSAVFTDIVVIKAAGAPAVAEPTLAVKLPNGTVGKKYVSPKPALTAPGCDTVSSRLARAVNCTVKYSAKGLPKGLSINAKTGVVTGTPKVKGTYTVKITATLSNGKSVTDTVTVKISGHDGAGNTGGGNATIGKAPKGSFLPSTGSLVEPWMLLVGFGLLGAGVLLIRLTRRRS